MGTRREKMLMGKGQATQACCPTVRGRQECRVNTTLPGDSEPGHQDRALTGPWAPSPRAEEAGPTENQCLRGQVETLQGLLEQVQQHVARQARAQAEARTRQSFLQDSQQLLLWAEGVWARLHSEEKAVDVASAQRLLMEHGDLLEEIRLQQERSGREAG